MAEESLPQEPEGITGILVKESADLDACRCGSYCGDTSREIIEVIEADSETDLVERAARMLPTFKHDRDAQPSLFIVVRDLSQEVQAAFKVRCAEELRLKQEKEAAEAERKRLASARARLQRLREEMAALHNGQEEARVRAKLMEAEAEVARAPVQEADRA